MVVFATSLSELLIAKVLMVHYSLLIPLTSILSVGAQARDELMGVEEGQMVGDGFRMPL